MRAAKRFVGREFPLAVCQRNEMCAGHSMSR